MGRTLGAGRDGDEHRRGPIGSNAQAARWVNFLDTLMRHFLPGAVGGLAGRVVAAAGLRRLVAAARRSRRCAPASAAALLAAVLLASVAATADVEYGCAVAAAALPKAVVKALRGA